MTTAMKVSALLSALTLIALAGVASAAGLKIGVVDRVVLLRQSPQAQAASKLMEQKFGNRSKSLIAQQNKIKNLQDQINRNGAVMSATQLQNLENQLDNMQQDFRRKQDDFQSDVNTQRNQEIGLLQDAIDKAAQQFAKANKYNLIIDKSVTYYSDATVDVTDQVLSQMKKDYKSQSGKSSSSSN